LFIESTMFEETDYTSALYAATKGNNITLIKLFLDKGAKNLEWGIIGAAMKGHKDLIDFFILKGAKDWHLGLEGAARGGKRKLCDFFLDKGASPTFGLYGAARGGHRILIDFFISKGANNFKEALSHAFYGGHYDIVEILRKKQKINKLKC